jgi:hypothetical protein
MIGGERDTAHDWLGDMKLENTMMLKWITRVAATVICGALVCSAPGRLEAQTEPPPQPKNPEIEWTNVKNYFDVANASWKTPTELSFKLRAKTQLRGVMQAYAYSGEEGWFDKFSVAISTRYGCGWGGPNCRLWSSEEEQTVSVSLPSNTFKVKFVFEGPVPGASPTAGF